MPYYVTVPARQDEQARSLRFGRRACPASRRQHVPTRAWLGRAQMLLPVMTAVILLSFCFYWPTNRLALRFGKKRMVLGAFGGLCVMFAYIPLIGLPPHPLLQLFLLAFFGSFPIAVLGMLPNAILADMHAPPHARRPHARRRPRSHASTHGTHASWAPP